MNLQDFRERLTSLTKGETDKNGLLADFSVPDIQEAMMSREKPELEDFQQKLVDKLSSGQVSAFLWSMFGQLGLVRTPFAHVASGKSAWFSDDKPKNVEDELYSQEWNIHSWLERLSKNQTLEQYGSGWDSCARNMFSMPLYWGMSVAVLGKNNLFNRVWHHPEDWEKPVSSKARMVFDAVDSNEKFYKIPLENHYGFSDKCIGDFQAAELAPEALADMARAVMVSRDEEEAQSMLGTFLIFRYFARFGRSFASDYFFNWGLFNQSTEGKGMQLNTDHENLQRFIRELKTLFAS